MERGGTFNREGDSLGRGGLIKRVTHWREGLNREGGSLERGGFIETVIHWGEGVNREGRLFMLMIDQNQCTLRFFIGKGDGYVRGVGLLNSFPRKGFIRDMGDL